MSGLDKMINDLLNEYTILQNEKDLTPRQRIDLKCQVADSIANLENLKLNKDTKPKHCSHNAVESNPSPRDFKKQYLNEPDLSEPKKDGSKELSDKFQNEPFLHKNPMYPIYGTLSDKVVFSLRVLKAATVNQIMDYMNFNENMGDIVKRESIHCNITILKKNSRIVVKSKEGKVCTYELNPDSLEKPKQKNEIDFSKLLKVVEGGKEYCIGDEVIFQDLLGRDSKGDIMEFINFNHNLGKTNMLIGNDGSIQTFKRYTSEVKLTKK